MSGAKSRSSRRNASSVSTRRARQSISARSNSRCTSSASMSRSSTSRMWREAGTASAGMVIQQQPVETDVGDGAGECLEIHRLHDVAVRPQAIGARDVGLLARRREHHHGDPLGAILFLEPPQHLEAVDLGELQIQEDDLGDDADLAQAVRSVPEKEVKSFRTIAAHEHLVGEVALLERPQRQLRVARIVFDQQDLDFLRVRHASDAPGSVKKNVAPASRWPSAHTRPPWRNTIRWTIARPTPVPSNSSARWRRWNTPNSLPAYRWSNPAPLSFTKYTVSEPFVLWPTSIRPGVRRRVNFAALSSRFVTAWRSMSRSPCTGGRGPTVISSARSPAVRRSSSATVRTSSAMSTGADSSSLRPSRENDSRSSISCPIRLVFWSMTPSTRLASVSSWVPWSSSRMRANPWIARSGARRSWDTEYENASSSALVSRSARVRSTTWPSRLLCARCTSPAIALKEPPSRPSSSVPETSTRWARSPPAIAAAAVVRRFRGVVRRRLTHHAPSAPTNTIAAAIRAMRRRYAREGASKWSRETSTRNIAGVPAIGPASPNFASPR